MGRWSVSFRSSDFSGDDRRDRQKHGRHPVSDLAPPVAADGQHPCPRGTFCASSTRGTDDAWHPLMINGAFCPADESAIANALPDLPRSYYLLAARIGDPVRSGRATGRRPPGSRVLVSAEADALLRTSAAVLMGWAARVRSVPGLQLSPNRHLPDKPEGVRDNCGVLARHVTQLLALPPGPVTRVFTWPPGDPMPPELDEEIGALAARHGGDGWVRAWTELSGVDAGLDVLDLAAKFRRLLGEAPARPEPLEGVPCRECEEIALVEAEPPHDPAVEKDKSKCTACSARMTAAEYAEWTKMYDAWVRGAGPLVCKLCKDGSHGTCWWTSCDCRKAGHAEVAWSLPY